jgi:HSP20 family protein
MTNPAIYSNRPLMELERLLGNAARSQSIPKVNILNYDDYSEIRIAVPGINKKEIEINFDKGILKIESKKEIHENTEIKSKFIIKEFDYSSFKVEYKISEKVDFNNINANMENGILIIQFPLKKELTLDTIKNIEIK